MIYLDTNSTKVSKDGDLSPKNVQNLKESHLKKKKKGGMKYIAE